MSEGPVRVPCLHVADIELPREVEKLYDLAYNLWWTWNREAPRLFAAIDSRSWAMYRNPVQLLINVEPSHWEPLLENEDFMSGYSAVIGALENYLDHPERSWFHRRHPDCAGGPIAYVSMEYGLHQSLALYSGGLGVLSGDHCKSASDLGLPLVAVGLLYRRGYFRQTIESDGEQQQAYPAYDFSRLPVRPAAGHTGREVLVSVPLPGREVLAKIWVAQVGRVPLLLLDTDIPQNNSSDRPITNILYVQGREMRLVQEWLLGVGGVRALRALGIEPAVWHLNEGHCAFAQAERIGERMASGRSFDEARTEVRRTTVFTTHTPVPAGNEQFDTALVHKYLDPWSAATGVPVAELFPLASGGANGESAAESFNLTALGLRTARFVNGVSRRNAGVLCSMWRHLFPEGEAGGQPIRPITNGVHVATWMGADIRALLDRRLGPGWSATELSPGAWKKVLAVPDEEIWAAHQAQ